MGERGHCNALRGTVLVLEKNYISERSTRNTKGLGVLHHYHWKVLVWTIQPESEILYFVYIAHKRCADFKYMTHIYNSPFTICRPSFLQLLSFPLHSHWHADLDSPVISIKHLGKEIKPYF